MILARINQGQVQVEVPIPTAWEGLIVKLVPLTPDDPLSELDEKIVALHDLGAIEFEPGEQEAITGALEQMNRLSKVAISNRQ